MSSTSDEFVAGVGSGQPGAFSALVSPHRTRLHAFFRVRLPAELRRLLSPEDLVQETLLHAFRGIREVSFGDEAAFRSWLFQIAQNVLNGHCRHLLGTKKRDVRHEVRLPTSAGTRGLAASATGAVTGIRREERLQRLERALLALPEEHREVIVLSRIEGLPLAAVAERMQRSPRAVSALLLRALKKLRAGYGETESLGLPLRGLRLPD